MLAALWFQPRPANVEISRYFYYASTWTNTSIIHECDWYGVECDEYEEAAGRVTNLTFSFIGKAGLPDDLGLLTALTRLDVGYNNMGGGGRFHPHWGLDGHGQIGFGRQSVERHHSIIIGVLDGPDLFEDE